MLADPKRLERKEDRSDEQRGRPREHAQRKTPLQEIEEAIIAWCHHQRDDRLRDRILDRAGERLQIIVLTCHERAYFDHGWTTKRLQDSREGV